MAGFGAPADDLPFHEGDRLTDFSDVDITAQRVASGGFGAVALGMDRRNNRWLAIKTLRHRFLNGDHVRELFVREALTWRGVWPHANVLTAQFVTEINSLPMLELDYAARGSLRDLLERSWLRWDSALLLAQQILAGLAYLHTPDPAFLRPQPIVHRDLKPENVLLDEYGYAVITDFGLAKVVAASLEHPGATLLGGASDEGSSSTDDDGKATLLTEQPVAAGATQAFHTARGVAFGTTAYMAPEQWEDAALAGTPADVYAAGLMIVELLTGRHPLFSLNERHTRQEWRLAHQEAATRLPPLETLIPADMRDDWPAGLATGVVEVVRACLAREPEARPAAGQALTALQELATRLGEKAYTPPEVYAHTPEHEMIVWDGWAVAYMRFGRNEEALLRNDRALALAPHNPKVLLNRGVILAQLHRYTEAEDAFQRSLAAHPPTDTEGCGNVWNMLGASRSEQERYTEAEAAFAQAVALNPGHATIWYNRACNAWLRALTEEQVGRATQARMVCADGVNWALEARRLSPNDTGTKRLLATLRALAARLG